ncbi:MAG: radical SAM protein, partial [Nanoarchaeota archaeon]
MVDKDTVLLFNLGAKSSSGYLPMPLLSIANFLMKGGFKAKIIDMRILSDEEIDKELQLDNVLYVALGVKTGKEIADAIKLSKKIKSMKDILMVWGGSHPSFLPEQTARHEAVDVVVRGEAEGTMLEIAQRISENKPIDDVKGITFKKDGKVVSNPDRPFLDVNEFGNLPYHLLNLEKYPLKDFFVYETSRGCPYKCTFCHNLIYNKMSYRRKRPEVVLNEIEYIMKAFNPKSIFITDDNIFVNKQRVEDICKGIIERNLKFNWSGFCRAEYFKGYDMEFLQLLKKSGFTTFSIGGESGSDKILDMIKKEGTIEDIRISARKCSEAGIDAVYSFIWGFPGETEDDFKQTVGIIQELWKMKHIKVNGLFMLIPYPGTPLYQTCLDSGYPERKSLEEWIDFGWNDKKEAERLVWVDKNFRKKANAIGEIVRYIAHRSWLREKNKNRKFGMKYVILSSWKLVDLFLYPAFMYRIKNSNLKLPLDLKTWMLIRDKYIG